MREHKKQYDLLFTKQIDEAVVELDALVVWGDKETPPDKVTLRQMTIVVLKAAEKVRNKNHN